MATIKRYGSVAVIIHWASAATVVSMFVIAVYMTDLPLGARKFEIYNLHKSLGVCLFVLTLLRVIWRFLHAPPAFPSHMPGWQKKSARASHLIMLGLLFLLPVTGSMHSWAAGFQIHVFDLVTLPTLMGKDDLLAERLGSLHHFLGWFLAALVIVHIGAALYHHFYLKDSVLQRMLPIAGGQK